MLRPASSRNTLRPSRELARHARGKNNEPLSTIVSFQTFLRFSQSGYLKNITYSPSFSRDPLAVFFFSSPGLKVSFSASPAARTNDRRNWLATLALSAPVETGNILSSTSSSFPPLCVYSMVIRQQKAAKIEFLKKRKQKTVSFNIRDTRLTPLDPFEKKNSSFKIKMTEGGNLTLLSLSFILLFFPVVWKPEGIS